MKLLDGKGRGNQARVTSENNLGVDSVNREIDLHINQNYQKYFSLTFDGVDPVGADDYFFYLKNTGTKNIHIPDFRFKSTVAGVVEVHYVTGTPSYTSSTAVTPINRFVGSANTLTATINTDTDTTGLTSGGVLVYIPLDTAGELVHVKLTAHIIIPPGQAIALLWDTATGVIQGHVSAYEEQDVT